MQAGKGNKKRLENKQTVEKTGALNH